MRLNKLIVLVAIIFNTLASLSFAESFGEKHDKVVRFFEGADEPAAQFALWSKPDVFKVGVIYEGVSRDDYAQHVCKVLYQEGFRGNGILVHILDAVKLTQHNEWAVIGVAHCD